MQLTWLDRAGKTVGTLGPPMSPNGFALSPDERQVALGRTDVEPQSIWAADVARATLTRLTLQGRFVSTPVWAHDGKSILFAAAVDSPPNLYSKHLNPIADDERLTRSPFQSFPDDWSRDGSLVVYRRYEPSSGSDLFVMSMKGDRKSQPLIQTASDEYGSRISPDGQWLVYVSNESGRDEVYITSFPKLGARFAVSSGGGTEPQWRPDGRELFYWAFAGAKTSLMAAGVDPGPPLKIAKPAELFEVSSFRAGPGPGPFYDVSANGRFLIGMPIKEDSQPVNIVLNWPAGVAPR
jgi:Tol biopolymer transport system component